MLVCSTGVHADIPVAEVVPWRMAEGLGPMSSEQVSRELSNLRQLFEARMDGSDKVLAQIQALQEERFRGLDARLIAARAALAEGKETAEKQQAQEYHGLQRQLEQLTGILTQANANSNDRLQALKERLDRIEGASAGVGASWGVLLALVTLLLGIGGAVVAFTRRQRG
jgi:hypothetical protein